MKITFEIKRTLDGFDLMVESSDFAQLGPNWYGNFKTEVAAQKHMIAMLQDRVDMQTGEQTFL